MIPMNEFIVALTQEKSKLVQMGAIKCSRNQALAASDAPKSSRGYKQNGKGKLMN